MLPPSDHLQKIQNEEYLGSIPLDRVKEEAEDKQSKQVVLVLEVILLCTEMEP